MIFCAHPQFRHIFLTVFFFVLLNLTKVVLEEENINDLMALWRILFFTIPPNTLAILILDRKRISPCQVFQEPLGQTSCIVSVDVECPCPEICWYSCHILGRTSAELHGFLSRPPSLYFGFWILWFSDFYQHHLLCNLASSNTAVSWSWARPHLMTVTTPTLRKKVNRDFLKLWPWEGKKSNCDLDENWEVQFWR